MNGRLKIFWGVDDGHVRGARRFHAHVGVVLVVHVALAWWLACQPRREGSSLGPLQRSPIAEALAELDAKRGAAAEHAAWRSLTVPLPEQAFKQRNPLRFNLPL